MLEEQPREGIRAAQSGAVVSLETGKPSSGSAPLFGFISCSEDSECITHTHTHMLLIPLNSEWPRLGSNKRVGFTSGTRAEGGGQSTLVDLCTVYLH